MNEAHIDAARVNAGTGDSGLGKSGSRGTGAAAASVVAEPAPPVTGEPFAPLPALSGVRSILRYRGRPLLRLEHARAASEHATAFEVLGDRFLVLFDPKAVEQVLVTQHAAFQKDRFTKELRRILGTGLLTSEGEEWRRSRKLMASSFQPNEIAAYGGIMAERAREFVVTRRAGEVFDVHSSMMHLTLDILVRALFGMEVKQAKEVEGLLAPFVDDYRPGSLAWRLVPEWVPLPSRRRLARTRRELDVILDSLIAERRQQQSSAEQQRSGEQASQSADLLGRLMLARDVAGSLSEVALRDEAMTLFLAGHETTALALTYALRLLALHPSEARVARAEIASVLGERLPTMQDVPRLVRIRAALDESLRLYPPVWGMAREPKEDVVISGVLVPKGVHVVVCPWVMHHDARFFNAPERFQPSRWIDQPSPPRFAYLPFGAGPRVCIGSHFALAEAVLVLATILQHVELELLPEPALELVPSVTLRPRGPVPMRFWPRAAPSVARRD
ncbi:MAG TPA: cytochrome P450 [Polyangiaceae bacterium]|nr:cytochrome P450 [Polyangiaceae bacterium]